MPSVPIQWSASAKRDVQRLFDFLAVHDADAAKRTTSATVRGGRHLQAMPYSGTAMPDDSGRREWLVSFGDSGYVLRYLIDETGRVVILRVYHQREHCHL